MLHDVDHREIFECAYLKFTVSGRSKQAGKQAQIHTRVRNAIMLVWGSLVTRPRPAFRRFQYGKAGEGRGTEKGREDLIECRQIVDVPTHIDH